MAEGNGVLAPPQYDWQGGGGGFDEAKKRRTQEIYEDEQDPEFSAEGDQASAINDRIVKTILEWASSEDVKRLGRFNDDTIHYLKEMDELTYSHEKVPAHIQRFVEEAVEEDPHSYIHDDKEKLIEDLAYLAFNKKTAELLVEFIPDNILSTQNAAYWATNFTENWILSDQAGSDKRKGIQNVWVSRNYQVTYANKNGLASEKTLPVYHEQGKEVRDIDFWDFDRDREQLFFHGTSKDAVDGIIRNGLVLSGGPFGQDFSYRHRPGFYLSDKLSNGRAWAQAKAAFSAIIVFKVPKEIFSNVGLDLAGKSESFQREVYAYNRSSGDKEITPETVDAIESSKVIQGPVLLNPKELFDEEEPRRLHLSPDSQLCILDEDVASQFYEHIYKIVYCNKQKLEAVIVE